MCEGKCPAQDRFVCSSRTRSGRDSNCQLPTAKLPTAHCELPIAQAGNYFITMYYLGLYIHSTMYFGYFTRLGCTETLWRPSVACCTFRPSIRPIAASMYRVPGTFCLVGIQAYCRVQGCDGSPGILTGLAAHTLCKRCRTARVHLAANPIEQ